MNRNRVYPLAIGQCLILIASGLFGPLVTAQPPEQALINAGGQRISVPVGDVNIDSWWFDVGPEIDDLKPALIHIHGWSEEGIHTGRYSAIYARAFSAARNIVGLGVTLRGWPGTGGENDCGLQQPSDISKIIDWLEVQPGIDPDRNGIVGGSQGGQVGLLAAAISKKVKAVVAYAPLTNVTTWHESTDLAEEMINEYVNGTCSTPGTKTDRSPIFVAEDIEANVLILHGEADERVSVNQSISMHESLLAAGENSTLITIPNAPHDPGAPEWDELATLERVWSWLDGNL
ncbi:MAG: prolyl oligopeptidase family serine peptidase [Pseudohongiella sp.]|uniref:alpha/beta hydrolase family protein n=1 Tax=Pseudohongiella sp. TaxID=1979412 RepID=UPI00349FDB41